MYGLLWLMTVAAASAAADNEAEYIYGNQVVNTIQMQVMMQDAYMAESDRNTGDSGIKATRNYNLGIRSYETDSHVTDNTLLGIHDWANHRTKLPYGQMTAVINGIEFRTAHTVVDIEKPSDSNSGYDEMQPIEFPPVPPSVLAQTTVADQITEMQSYFVQWRKNNNFNEVEKYFKVILCYLEGAWEKLSDQKVAERTTLLDEARFAAATGTMHKDKSFPFLPTRLMKFANGPDDTTIPEYSYWNYRIKCAPVTTEGNHNVDYSTLRPVEDLASRMRNNERLVAHKNYRRARYMYDKRERRSCMWCSIDYLMEKIPGKDNYGGFLADTAFQANATHILSTADILNTAYYHRVYKAIKRGAMGVTSRSRGFSDTHMFMAQTSRPEVASLTTTDCRNTDDGSCVEYEQRWTYAIPLEIIVLTPLHSWNPYNLTYYSDNSDPNYAEVDAGGRNGGLTKDTAYAGIRDDLFFQTPAEFFTSGEFQSDAADITTNKAVGVLGPDGEVKRVRPSGIRFNFPNIPTIWRARQRFPMFPIYNDGSTVLKNVEGLKDAMMLMSSHGHIFIEK